MFNKIEDIREIKGFDLCKLNIDMLDSNYDLYEVKTDEYTYLLLVANRDENPPKNHATIGVVKGSITEGVFNSNGTPTKTEAATLISNLMEYAIEIFGEMKKETDISKDELLVKIINKNILRDEINEKIFLATKMKCNISWM